MPALFIILVGQTVTLFTEKILISNRCIDGLMPNLFKKSVRVLYTSALPVGLIFYWNNFRWEPKICWTCYKTGIKPFIRDTRIRMMLISWSYLLEKIQLKYKVSTLLHHMISMSLKINLRVMMTWHHLIMMKCQLGMEILSLICQTIVFALTENL